MILVILGYIILSTLIEFSFRRPYRLSPSRPPMQFNFNVSGKVDVFHHIVSMETDAADRLAKLEALVGQLADDFRTQIDQVKSDVANVTNNVKTHVDNLTQKIADLQDQVNNSSMTAQEKQELLQSIGGIDTDVKAIDPTDPTVLPPEPGPAPVT